MGKKKKKYKFTPGIASMATMMLVTMKMEGTFKYDWVFVFAPLWVSLIFCFLVWLPYHAIKDLYEERRDVRETMKQKRADFDEKLAEALKNRGA